jgi:hypothetical protein
MSWNDVAIGAAVGVLYLAAAGVLVVGYLRGRISADRMPRQAIVVLALAFGSAIWLWLAANPESDLSWTWLVAAFLGVVAAIGAVDERVGARILRLSAWVSPVLAALAVTAFYVLDTGITDGADGIEPIWAMLFVAVVGAALFYLLPALVVSALMAAPRREPATSQPGWYIVGGEAGAGERYWNGHAWSRAHRSPPKAA